MASNEECRANEEKLKSVVDMFIHVRDKAQATDPKYISAILYQKNKENMTPLVLSAKLSCPEMFKVVVNTTHAYRLLGTAEGISNIYKYDVSEIDSAVKFGHKVDCKCGSFPKCAEDRICGRDSVLEVIMANSHEYPQDYFKFTEISPVLNLIRAKWEIYRPWYIGWGVLHLIMMILYTLAIVPLDVSRGPKAASLLAIVLIDSDKNSTKESSALFPQNWLVVDIFLMLYMIYTGYILAQELYQLSRLVYLVVVCKAPAWSLAFNPVGDGCYRALLIFYGIFTLISYPLYYNNKTAAHTPQIFGLILGWSFLMFFSRGWKIFSFFTVIIQSAFLDKGRFALMYVTLLIQISAAMSILFQFSSEVPEFSNFQKSLLTMFQLTLGLSEVDVKIGATQPGMAVVVYLSYLTMTYILLLNMVIALLSDTCSRVASNRQCQWHLQKLGIILFIESRLLPRHRSQIGVPAEKKVAQIESQEDSTLARGVTRNRVSPINISRPRDYMKVTSIIDPKTEETAPTLV